MRWQRVRADDGMVTAFVTIFVIAVLFVVGLVIDGGYMLSARRRAINEAESAARAGAQVIDLDSLRGSGDPQLDPARAEVRAEEFLARRGLDGEATATADSVSVTVRIVHRPILLSIGGLGETTLTGTGTARAAQGNDP